MEAVQEAVNALEQLGLTEYEAKCFVALTRIPHGTAKEVAQVADVPRSRVYETMEQLKRKGLVEVEEAEPRTFQGVTIDSAVRILRSEYESYFETVEQRLHEVEPTYKEAANAVWAITNREQVTERILDLVSDANDEVVLILVDERLLDEELLEYLGEASERGVTVSLGTQIAEIRERVDQSDVDVEVFSTDLIRWFGEMSGPSRIGRILLVDRGPALTSAVHGEELPGVLKETAAWSDGINHGFATFLQRILTYELEEKVAQQRGEPESS